MGYGGFSRSPLARFHKITMAEGKFLAVRKAWETAYFIRNEPILARSRHLVRLHPSFSSRGEANSPNNEEMIIDNRKKTEPLYSRILKYPQFFTTYR
jgi:hypothetical protein